MILVRGDRHYELEQCEGWCDEFRAGVKDILAYKKGLEAEYNRTHKLYNDFGAPVVPGDSVFMTLFNGLIQGQSSQMIFHASLLAFRKLWKIGCKPLCWVHDEVIWRIPLGANEAECVKMIDAFMCGYKLETPYGRVPLACEGHLGNEWVK
jgi:hypothetical protein